MLIECATLLTGGSEVLINLEDGRCIKVPATDAVRHDHITSVKIGRKAYKLIYDDASVVEVNKPVEVLKEVIGFRIILLDKLTNDTAFINNMKALGHKAATITSLKNKLATWLADTTKTWSLNSSSPMFTLYNDAYNQIKSAGITV